MRKQMIYMFLIMLIFSGIIKADTLEEGRSVHNSDNHTNILKFLLPMAKNGNAAAQGKLCQMYLKGKDVTRDYEQAFTWCNLAANQGNLNAQANLGFMYGHGKGVNQNYQKALKWYRLAADL